jgi:hypothetical protein
MKRIILEIRKEGSHRHNVLVLSSRTKWISFLPAKMDAFARRAIISYPKKRSNRDDPVESQVCRPLGRGGNIGMRVSEPASDFQEDV